ncbi:MAG TPA: paraquat-inducible protein A [Caldimonas sp.]
MTRTQDSLVVCERCGKAHRWRLLGPGAVARCTRCEAVLGRGHRLGVETVLALTVTALIVFLIASFADVIAIRLGGNIVATTLPGAVWSAWRDGEQLVAVTAAVTALVAPALFILLRLYVLVPLAAGRVPPGFGFCVRALHQVSRWNMVEVLTVGGLLSLVRLAALAEATPGPAMFALGLLTLLFAAIESAGLRHLWWYVR